MPSVKRLKSNTGNEEERRDFAINSRNHESVRETVGVCIAKFGTAEVENAGLFIGMLSLRTAAPTFLFDPRREIARGILDDDSRPDITEILHRFAVYEIHVKHFQHDLRGCTRIQSRFQFRNVFFRELAPQSYRERVGLSSGCRNL